jgi:hypothetical protein
LNPGSENRIGQAKGVIGMEMCEEDALESRCWLSSGTAWSKGNDAFASSNRRAAHNASACVEQIRD